MYSIPARNLSPKFLLSAGALAIMTAFAGCSTPAAGTSSPPPAAIEALAYSPSDPDSDDLTPEEEEALAKAAQNPLASLISLPFQSNTNFDWGPEDETQNVLNIQPVVPFELGDDWNLITRTILPVIDQPVPGGSSEFGLGDTTITGWFSPNDTEGWTWGVGPMLLLPTASDDLLGAGEWGAGASAVALVMSGKWVAGGLASNVWSFESSSVNSFLFQPFINYNLDKGWYLVTAPTLTANWESPSGERWTVPIGGGFGKVFKLGNQPVNMNLAYYKNVDHPTLGAEWQIRFQIQFLFPKG